MKRNPTLVKIAWLILAYCKIKSFRYYQTDYIEEWVENCCDGGLLIAIAENFYLRKEELYQQSLSCVGRNKCLLKKRE